MCTKRPQGGGSVLDDRPVADLARLEPIADFVDPLERVDFEPGLHLPRRGEVERFDQIAPVILFTADDPHLVRLDVHKVDLDQSIHQATADHLSLRPEAAHRLTGVRHRVRSPEDDVSTARLEQGLTEAARSDDDVCGPEPPGFFLLLWVPDDRDHLEAERLGVLDGEVPQTADAEDGDSVAGAGIRVPQAAHDREAGAEDRRRLFVAEARGHERAAGGPGEHQLRIAASHLDPGLILGAIPLALLLTEAAAALAPLGPGDADPVAGPQAGHVLADLHDLAHRLAPEDQGQGHRHDPVMYVQVGPAHAAGADSDEHLAGLRLRVREVLDRPGFSDFRHDGCAHLGSLLDASQDVRRLTGDSKDLYSTGTGRGQRGGLGCGFAARFGLRTRPGPRDRAARGRRAAGWRRGRAGAR